MKTRVLLIALEAEATMCFDAPKCRMTYKK